MVWGPGGGLRSLGWEIYIYLSGKRIYCLIRARMVVDEDMMPGLDEALDGGLRHGDALYVRMVV
jgi:hypothetical protein